MGSESAHNRVFAAVYLHSTSNASQQPHYSHLASIRDLSSLQLGWHNIHFLHNYHRQPIPYSSVPVWPVTVTAEDTTSVTFTPVQSIMPLSTILTLPGSITLFPPTVITATPASGSSNMCTATSTGPVITPSAIQTGIPSDCSTFVEAVSGDTCDGIAAAADISFSEFLDMNPAVGSDCSELWANYYYCVAVSSDSGCASGVGGSSTCSWSSGVSPTFFSTSHVVTILPQPTVSVPIPMVPPIVYGPDPSSSLPPWEGTTPGCAGCGSWGCSLFGCPPGTGGSNGAECGLFACDGGCGIFGCAGLCGLFSCGCPGKLNLASVCCSRILAPFPLVR